MASSRICSAASFRKTRSRSSGTSRGLRIQTREEIERTESRIEQEAERRVERAQAQHAEFGPASAAAAEAAEMEGEGVAVAVAAPPAPAPQPFRRFTEKVGRNDPCPCASGRKSKLCHGRVA